MIACPACRKKLRLLERECPTCKADLSLLVGFVQSMQDGLERARALTRQGRLRDAVRAYLEVLEVDPGNPEAREQISEVATAVRLFDRARGYSGELSLFWRSVLLLGVCLTVLAAGILIGLNLKQWTDAWPF